jgi:inhibitor of growth protein 4
MNGMNGMNSILYLESFVDSTQSMPPDLQRHLNTIKALDEKCLEISDVIHHNVNTLLSMPPQHVHGATEYIEVSRRVESDQRLVLQFAEEKVQVAQQVYDLLELHAMELEKQIDDFEGDLRSAGVLDAGNDSFYSPGFVPLDSARGRAPKLDDWSSMAPRPSEGLAVPLPAMPSIKRSAPAVAQKASHKRPRDEGAEPFAAAATPVAMPAAPSPAPGPLPSMVSVGTVAVAAPAAAVPVPASQPKRKQLKSVSCMT